MTLSPSPFWYGFRTTGWGLVVSSVTFCSGPVTLRPGFHGVNFGFPDRTLWPSSRHLAPAWELFLVHLSRWTRHLSQQPMYQSPSTVNPPHSSMAPSLPSAVGSLLQPLEANDISSYTEDNFPFSHLSLKSGEQGRSTFCAPAEDKTLYFHSDVGLLGKQ